MILSRFIFCVEYFQEKIYVRFNKSETVSNALLLVGILVRSLYVRIISSENVARDRKEFHHEMCWLHTYARAFLN